MPRDSILTNRLLRNILVVAVVIICALIAYNAFLTIPSFTSLLVATTKADAVRITRHLQSYLLVSDQHEIGSDSLNAQLVKEVGRLQQDFELMDLKVFSASGQVVFSSDNREVGDVNSRPYFRDIVAKGRVYAEVVPKNRQSLEGKTMARDVLETYVPLMKNGRFLGAFEIYYDITDSKTELQTLVTRSSTITFTFAAGLLTAIILVLRQEHTSMAKRQQLEQERLQRERLEGVIEMAGAACHELNQPLQTILAYSHLLAKKLPPGSPQGRDLEDIRAAVDQLGKVTLKIMHIARYETKEYAEGSRIIDIDKASSWAGVEGEGTPD